jgi:hypothetical protein
LNLWTTGLFEGLEVGVANHQNEALRNLRYMDEIERQSGDGKDRGQEQRGEGAFLKLLSDRDIYKLQKVAKLTGRGKAH